MLAHRPIASVLPHGTNAATRKSVSRAAVLLAALAVPGTLALTGCDDGVPDNAQLVQGHDNCVVAMEKNGETVDQAKQTCDNAQAQAMMTHQRETHETNDNSMLYYYLIMQNNNRTYPSGYVPPVYRRASPSSNLEEVGSVARAPTSIATEDVEFYSRAPSARVGSSAPSSFRSSFSGGEEETVSAGHGSSIGARPGGMGGVRGGSVSMGG